MEFAYNKSSKVGDHVFLKVMPKRGAVRFGKGGKLSPRVIGPFEILERIGTVAYRLALPPSMSGVTRLHSPEIYSRSSPCGGLGIDRG